MAIRNDDVAFGRILERLDQQDRNTLLREQETKEIAVRLAEENSRTAKILADALASHTADDEKQFKIINDKLDVLIADRNLQREFRAKQSGIILTVTAAAAALATAITWLVTYFSGK